MALGSTRAEQGAVLYLALEDNKRRLQRRLGKVLAGRDGPRTLHIATDWPRADEGGVEELDTWLTKHPDARLIVIDTFARFKPHSSRRRTAYDEDRDAVDLLIPLAAEHGVCVLLVHHLREMESEDPWNMITGSTGLIGGVDGALVMKRRRGQADAYLHVDGRDIENPRELALNFDADAATWAIVGDADEYRMGDRRMQVISRAALLLRVSTGACARLLEDTGVGREDLEFWWKSLGEDRGLWEPGGEPDELTDLWLDVDAELKNATSWRTSSAGLVSMARWIREQARTLTVLGGCERIALWGMGL